MNKYFPASPIFCVIMGILLTVVGVYYNQPIATTFGGLNILYIVFAYGVFPPKIIKG